VSASDELEAEIRAEFQRCKQAGEYDADLDRFMAEEVIPAWVANSPEDSGDYKDSVMVKHPAKGGKGAVGTSIGYAHLIEYGSNDTPEFAPRAKVAASFNNGSTGDYGKAL
jgi:hypothetical protein